MSEPGICANCGHSAGHHRNYTKSCSFQNSCECQKFVTLAPSPTDLPDAERFMAKVQGATDGCWLWTGFVSADGYGQFRSGRVMVKAHRWSYLHFVGDIPDGMETDHLCRVRHCVNPDHLEVVTHAENMARSSAAKTHCKNGHEFTPENTRLRSGDGKRDCRACNKIAVQKYQAKRRAQKNG